MTSHLIDFFRLVLDASWQSSLIILFILLIRPLMGSQIPAQWRYWLWALVLVRLLVPISAFPPSPVSMQNIALVDQPIEQAALVLPPSHAWVTYPNPGLVHPGPEASEPSARPVPPPPVESYSISWWCLAALIWLAGTVISLTIIIGAQIVLWRQIGKDRRPVDPAVLAIWKTCCQRLHITRGPALRMSQDMFSPALVGLIRPVLLLPEKNLAVFSPDDWENVFVHELAHYRRGDHWTHALHLVALAVHWFNPLVWFGFRQLRADRELAADEWALQHLDPERSTTYGDTLLKVLTQTSRAQLSLASVGILEDRVQLKQRLQRIVAFGPRTLFGSLLGLGIVLAVSLLVLGRGFEKADLTYYDGLTPGETLVLAAHRGDMPVIRKMLRDGVDINVLARYEWSETPLNAAVSAGQQDVMRFLISRGADVNLKFANPNAPSPVLNAMTHGETECANYLLERGATCDPLNLAAFKGDLATLQPVLAQPSPDFLKIQALAKIAAANGQIDAFKLLADKIHTLPGKYSWQIGDDTYFKVVSKGDKAMLEAFFSEGSDPKKFRGMPLARACSQCPGMRDWFLSLGNKVPVYTDGERFIDAAQIEDIPEMERLLKLGVDVNFRSDSQWTPIVLAARSDKVQSIKFLLDHGADPNSVAFPGSDWTALAATDSTRIADLLFAKGANVHGPHAKENDEIIWHSINFGPPAMVKWFIDHGVDVSKPYSDGRTLLFDVSDPAIAELLIQHGADVKAKDKDGETALYSVCLLEKKPAEIARVLLKHGADPNAQDNYGRTPLMVAPDGPTVDVLVQYGADLKAKDKQGNGVMESHGMNADGSRLDALIRHGAAPDPTAGPTLLMDAAWRGQADSIQSLLNHGVDPNLKGTWNKQFNAYMTPLTAAVVSGQSEAAALLVQYGAKIDEQLMADALLNRRASIIKLFWDHGARMISPLLYAVSQGAPVDELQKLLDQGNPVNPPEDKGISPLNDAALLGDLPAVQLLVDRGANMDRGSLDLAASEGQDETVAYLLQHGARPTIDAMIGAVNNSTPYRDELSADHFEKTVKILIDAGVLKGISEPDAARVLESALFTRQGPANLNVVKMLIAAGLSTEARFPNGKTVMQDVREINARTNYNMPSKEVMALLEQADKTGTVK